MELSRCCKLCLLPLLPEGFRVDGSINSASDIPFRLLRVHLRWLLGGPFTSSFLEGLNLQNLLVCDLFPQNGRVVSVGCVLQDPWSTSVSRNLF